MSPKDQMILIVADYGVIAMTKENCGLIWFALVVTFHTSHLANVGFLTDATHICI